MNFKAEFANDPNSQMAIAEIGEIRYHQQTLVRSSGAIGEIENGNSRTALYAKRLVLSPRQRGRREPDRGSGGRLREK